MRELVTIREYEHLQARGELADLVAHGGDLIVAQVQGDERLEFAQRQGKRGDCVALKIEGLERKE